MSKHPAERNIAMTMSWLEGMHQQMDGPGQPQANSYG
jgi:hypothetical protein